MIQSVALAVKARHQFLSARPVCIALSLGPFGATLSPAQEFDGFYPPPFGPRAYNQQAAANVNSFDSGARHLEEDSIEALAQFHFERLIVFLDDVDTWNTIDCIAFETVPLFREIRAIRRAMLWLQEEIDQRQSSSKAWWISLVFPGGLFPETGSGHDRSAKAVVAIAFEVSNWKEKPLPSPDGLGINCTTLEYLPTLTADMTNAIQQLSLANPPWLVIYPNGGDVYDNITQTWIKDREQSSEDWGSDLLAIVAEAKSKGSWGGVIVGGCCRTTPLEIKILNKGLLRDV